MIFTFLSFIILCLAWVLIWVLSLTAFVVLAIGIAATLCLSFLLTAFAPRRRARG